MTYLTKHFTLDEFIKSETADKLGIDNTRPSVSAVIAMTRLAAVILQPLRDYLGAPIVINSGYRCQSLNKAVGGAYGSQHMAGEAADLSFPLGRDYLKKALDYIRYCTNYDQLIYYERGASSFLHVSYKHAGNRHQFITKQ